MRRAQRLIAAAVLISIAGVLSGCASGLSGFDPSDLLDFLDTKKKLPGERKAVFPEGVPGLQPGVPKDLYKGAAAEPAPPETAPPPAEPPKSKRASHSGSKSRHAPAQRAAPDPDASAEEGSTAAAPPAPAKRIVRRRTTAPPPDAQPAAEAPAPQQQAAPATSAFPAPLPSGSFSR